MTKKFERAVMRRGAGRDLFWSALALFVLTIPAMTRQVASQRAVSRIDELKRSSPLQVDAREARISLRVARLGGLLASWETIGGCGAGGTATGGGGVKWIGHNVTGGLFHLQLQGSYMPIPEDELYSGGVNYTLTTQIDRDLGEEWNAGALVPVLYKRYDDYYGLPVNVSNSGVGDVSLFLTRYLGPIHATSATLTLGLPTGVHDARYENDLLTQDKQLGFGRLTAQVSVDHVFDETWGLFLLGGSASYRGGENELESYRAPSASLYGHAGYFWGPFVPAAGLTLTGFAAKERDRNLEQDVPLVMLALSGSVEWSTDTIAVLGGVSLPFALDEGDPLNDVQPWVASIGVAVSPF